MGWLHGPDLIESSVLRGAPEEAFLFKVGTVMSPPDLTGKLETQYLPWPHFPAGKLFLSTSLMQLSLTAHYLSSSSIHFSCYDAPSLYRLGWLCFMPGSGRPLPSFCRVVPSAHQVSTNIAWRQCQFCKHWEAIIKSLFVIPGMCLKLLLYREAMFSELLPYRGAL